MQLDFLFISFKLHQSICFYNKMLKRVSRYRETERELSLEHAAPLITTESFRRLFFLNKGSNKPTVHFVASTKQQTDKVSD